MSVHSPMLKVDRLSSGYGGNRVLQKISFEVSVGESVGIMGANGAGKTTLLKAICGLLPVQEGQILFDNQDITAMSADKIARLGLTMVPEGHPTFREMSVRENLLISLSATRFTKKEVKLRIEEVLDLFPILRQRMEQKAGTLSGGEQQMLAIARALMSRPKMLVLDEPSLGLAPLVIREISEKIKKLTEHGTTVLLIEQNVKMIAECTDRSLVIKEGRIVAGGDLSQLSHERLSEYYLGNDLGDVQNE